MVSKRLRALLVGVATLAILLMAGCGSSGSDEEGLTKAQYVKQGTALCVKVVKGLGDDLEAFAKARNIKGETNQKQLGEAVEEVILPGLLSEVEQLRELPPPDADEEKITAMLDKIEAGIAEGGKDPESFLGETKSQFSEGREMAEAYGLERCAAIL